MPKSGNKRKELSPKASSPKRATSPKQIPKQAPEQGTITKASGEIVLAPTPRSRPKAAAQDPGEQVEDPMPKVTLKPASARAPLRVPVAAEAEEQELRPAKGSLSDPASSIPIKAAPAVPAPKPGKGKQAEPPAAQSIRLVFDFHGGVLSLCVGVERRLIPRARARSTIILQRFCAIS